MVELLFLFEEDGREGAPEEEGRREAKSLSTEPNILSRHIHVNILELGMKIASQSSLSVRCFGGDEGVWPYTG